MDKPPYEIIAWENAGVTPLRPYTCYDHEGVEIKLNPKNPEMHDSWHPLQDDPALFNNLRVVVSEPEAVALSTSNNIRAIQTRQNGKIVVYSHKNLINKISFPAYPDISANVEVVVHYPNDGTTPYSLTYLIGPNL